MSAPAPVDLAAIVVIVDMDDRTYYGHHALDSLALCQAFADGMEAAWEISHGPSNCWQPFVLGYHDQRAEWEAMGSPGLDAIRARGAK